MVNPFFYFIFWKGMSCRFHFMYHFGLPDVVTSSYCHLKWENWIFIFTLHLTMFFWLYLGCFESIVSQISICCCWDCALQEKWHVFLIYMMWSWSNFWLKVKSPNLQHIRFMSTEVDYCSYSLPFLYVLDHLFFSGMS